MASAGMGKADRAPAVRKITRDGNLSMLHEHRGHCSVWDFHTEHAVSAIPDDDGARPVEYLKHFVQNDGRPAFYFLGTGDDTKVAADARMFASSELKVADATRLARGATAAVGRLALPPTMPLASVAELLVAADVVLTYMHIGSELAMEERPPDGKGAAFVFQGSHEYFTNERNVDQLHFEIRFHENGDVTVSGL